MKVLGMDKTVEVTLPFLVVIPDAQDGGCPRMIGLLEVSNRILSKCFRYFIQHSSRGIKSTQAVSFFCTGILSAAYFNLGENRVYRPSLLVRATLLPTWALSRM